MKKYLFILLIITVCFTVISCDKKSSDMTKDEFLDVSKSHKPVENDISSCRKISSSAKNTPACADIKCLFRTIDKFF